MDDKPVKDRRPTAKRLRRILGMDNSKILEALSEIQWPERDRSCVKGRADYFRPYYLNDPVINQEESKSNHDPQRDCSEELTLYT
jgi:hypothetical protein